MFILRNFHLLTFLILLPCISIGQDKMERQDDPWPEEIMKALGAGDAGSLASHFSSTVDLGLPEKEDSYSKSQGELIMRDFFKKCPPESFEVLQKGDISGTTLFAICDYITADEKYQVSVYLNKEKDKYLITRIKFEKKVL